LKGLLEDIQDRSISLSRLDSIPVDELGSLIEMTYDFRCYRMDAVQHLCRTYSFGDRDIWKSILWMGQLKAIGGTLVKAATKITSFQNITIYPVDEAWSERSWLPLDQILTNVGISAASLPQVLGPKFIRGEAEQRIQELQGKLRFEHAEVRLLLYLLKNCYDSIKDVLPYMGCSKQSCFLCSKFLVLQGKFSSRGCHGRLYPRWTIPPTAGLPPPVVDKLVESVV
jgi:hypothetical protein